MITCILIYLFLIHPRWVKKANRKPFLNCHYAHRGLFDNDSDAPENSLAAFLLAVNSNYGIEFDVQLSKDNKLVVFHDDTLERMCHVKGHVWDYTLEELKSFRLLNSSETIPTFEEALSVVNGKVPLIIEYKLDRVQTTVCELANEVLLDYNGTYCIECFHPKALIWYKKNRPDVLRGQLCQEFYKVKKYKGNFGLAIFSFLITNVATRPDFIAYCHKHQKNISRRLCRKMGALSVAWTVRSMEEYESCKDAFDLFIFDHVRL